MKLATSILVGIAAASEGSAEECAGSVFTVTCMPDFVIGVSIDTVCLSSKYGLLPTDLEVSNGEVGDPVCTACTATNCDTDLNDKFFSDDILAAPVSSSAESLYFQAGYCGSEMADDTENPDNIVFSTQVGATPKEYDSIVATVGLAPIQFSCKYSRILDTISYEPVGLTVVHTDLTET